MAALAILLRYGRRAHSHAHAHAHGLPLSRALCTTTAGIDSGATSASMAMRRLRREFDPDRAVAILETIDMSSISAGSTRNALSMAARRLLRAGRFGDAEALISSHLSACKDEPYLAAVLCSYASANLPEKALDAFRSTVPSLPTPISPQPFNALLSTFLRCGLHHRIPTLFAELSKEFSITPNDASYSVLVKSYCMTRNDAKAKQTLDQMREQGISPSTKTYTPLIDSMYKQKKTKEAELLWKEMIESGCKPDVAVYNVKVTYYGLQRKLEEVMQVMSEMEADGVKPDIITYNFLMSSYCKNGKLEDAKVVYDSLAEKGCSTNAFTYKYMLSALCASGDFDAGLGIFKESLKKNKVPGFSTVKGLVEGFVKGGRVAEAKKVIAEIHDKFPDNLSRWKKLEKELGLDSDSENTPCSEGTSGKIVAEAKSVPADAEGVEGSAVDETAVSEESSDDEAPVAGEVPRGPA
ncbi:unnamed protein product [Urochloa decumbens]|uniref:Pentatricopeptide repeat-containing protein n=1 Tax=Urochloa decumbens TaxID=240449 RepID=A0ABC8V9Q8_9POAL